MNTTSYRLVHFSPDPATGLRFPIAALVGTDDGAKVEFVPHLPGAKCLGSEARFRAVHRIQQRLMRVDSLDRIPSFGPYVSLSEIQDVPAETAEVFIQNLLAPFAKESPVTAERAPSRSSEGMKWFSSQSVARWVKKGFKPGQGDGQFLKDAPALEQISHYVGGSQKLMLMEPLVLRPKFGEDVKKIARRLASYSCAINSTGGPATTLHVYALPGLSKNQLGDVKMQLKFTGAQVIDVARDSEKTDFLGQIQSLTSEPLLSL